MSAPSYRIVVKGELGPRYSAAFDAMTLQSSGGETAIVGRVEDQAQLQGILERIAALNLVLLSVNVVDDPDVA
jgi:outer membrane PBP1 activator LpoA protein